MIHIGQSRIRTQLIFLLSVVIALFLVASLVSYLALDRAKTAFTGFIEQDQRLLLNYTELYANGLQMGQALRNIILDPANTKAYQNFDKATEAMDSLLKETRELTRANSAQTPALTGIVERRDLQKGYQKEIKGLVEAGQIEAAKEMLNTKETPVWREIRQGLLDLIKAQKGRIKDEEAAVRSRANEAQNISLGLSLLAAGVGIVLGLLILGNILVHLRRLGDSMAALSSGDADLTRRLPVEGDNELGRIAASFNVFMDGLRDMVNDIKGKAGRLDGLSASLAISSSGLRQGTHEQANAVNSTAAAVEEMTASIASVADGSERIMHVSQESARYSEEARGKMDDLGRVMLGVQEAVRGMSGSVNQFLESTQSIIGATQHVKDIADQINLLALNAAIEAARAGEQGRGFAVVADEVRKLAEKTALYANEISKVTTELGSRSSQVEAAIRDGEAALVASSECSASVGDIIDKSHASVVQAAHGVEGVVEATREQSKASADIARNIERLANTASGTEHAIGQADEAVREMHAVADALNAMVARFKS